MRKIELVLVSTLLIFGLANSVSAKCDARSETILRNTQVARCEIMRITPLNEILDKISEVAIIPIGLIGILFLLTTFIEFTICPKRYKDAWPEATIEDLKNGRAGQKRPLLWKIITFPYSMY